MLDVARRHVFTVSSSPTRSGNGSSHGLWGARCPSPAPNATKRSRAATRLNIGFQRAFRSFERMLLDNRGGARTQRTRGGSTPHHPQGAGKILTGFRGNTNRVQAVRDSLMQVRRTSSSSTNQCQVRPRLSLLSLIWIIS